MKLLEQASAKAVLKGRNLVESGKVRSMQKLDENTYVGKVDGSHGEVYDVQLDLKRPRYSTCQCAFAKERHVVCKHMVALFLTAFPEGEMEITKRMEMAEEQEERRLEKRYADLKRYVYSLSKEELRERLLAELVGHGHF